VELRIMWRLETLLESWSCQRCDLVFGRGRPVQPGTRIVPHVVRSRVKIEVRQAS